MRRYLETSLVLRWFLIRIGHFLWIKKNCRSLLNSMKAALHFGISTKSVFHFRETLKLHILHYLEDVTFIELSLFYHGYPKVHKRANGMVS